jgi:hypothetical protein|tara:strand:- start:228 stop:539 length:312 start_codon:yes stop_codon:yes gene_type:complete
LNNSFLDQLDVFPRELTAEEVILSNVKELDSLGSVEVLLDVLFTVHLADWGFSYHMVSIVIAVVLNIMAEGCNDERKSVHIIKLSILHKPLSFQNKVDVLSHI